MKKARKAENTTLRVPGGLGRLIVSGSFSEDAANPMVVFDFADGSRSLFDTAKGLFLSPPAGETLPSRAELKEFGRLIQVLRRQTAAETEACVPAMDVTESDLLSELRPIREFALVS